MSCLERDLAAAVLVVALASEVPMLKLATLTEDALRMLSSLQMAAVEASDLDVLMYIFKLCLNIC